MTDREERQHVIEVLKSWDGYFFGYTSDEVQEALRYAINSIKTDLKYDLLYEETREQADKPTTPNDCETCIHNKDVLECDMYGCKYEPTTKNCESCKYYGSHHEVCNYCYKCSLWTEQEPTTKNDKVDCKHTDCKNCVNHKYCDYESNCSEIPTGSTTKNNLAVDCISRQFMYELGATCIATRNENGKLIALGAISELPSVTPQDSKIGHCKDCKYFEYDSMANVDGIPLIVAHEICSKWGDGCKTRENGYCFLFEPKADMREVEE